MRASIVNDIKVEVLNGKRKLTMAMVWKLHTGLGIPAESLIRQAA
jgi:HTH-type transcriptional regulator/antitoxin HigA